MVYQNLLASVIDTVLSGVALVPNVLEVDGMARAFGIVIMATSKERGEVRIILNAGRRHKGRGY